jgi:hypothetical protein
LLVWPLLVGCTSWAAACCLPLCCGTRCTVKVNFMWRTLLILVEKGKSQDEVKLTKAGQRLYFAAGGKAEQARLPTLAA